MRMARPLQQARSSNEPITCLAAASESNLVSSSRSLSLRELAVSPARLRTRARAVALGLLLAGSVGAQSPRLDVDLDVLGSTGELVTGLRNSGLDIELLGGLAEGEATADVLELSLDDALERGLRYNLGLYLQHRREDGARAARRDARSELLPSLSAEIRSQRDQINFEASPFSRFRPDDSPVGPAVATFDIFDARLAFDMTLFDLGERRSLAAQNALEQAAGHTTQLIRNAVVLLVGNLYFRVNAAERHLDAAQAQVRTAEAFVELVDNRLTSGLAARMDGLRAQATRSAARQRQIGAEAELGKSKLRLARAIGLPLGQEFRLIDILGYSPVELDPEEAIEIARTQRPDYLHAQERVSAARLELASARSERLPSLAVEADVGSIGASANSGRTTYGAAAVLSVPLYDGGRLQAEIDVKRAALDAAGVRLRDLEVAMHYQLQEALLDERAADAAVAVAREVLDIANQQLVDARSRFEVGLSSSLEVVEAQELLANARVGLIDAEFAHRLAKGAIARAIGISDAQIREILIDETRRKSESDPR